MLWEKLSVILPFKKRPMPPPMRIAAAFIIAPVIIMGYHLLPSSVYQTIPLFGKTPFI